MEKISKQLAGLAKEFEQLANESDLDDSDVYSCLICRDCGWIIDEEVARKCSCQTKKETKVKQLPIPRLRKNIFANFDLAMYPENLKTPRTGKSYRQAAEEAYLEAFEFTTSIARGINRPGLIFEGPVGSGKTFLASAIANELISKGIDVEFIVVPEFLDKLRQNIKQSSDTTASLIERTQKVPILIFDDLGAHNYSEWVQNTLFNIINYRLNYQLPMIITTNLSYEKLEEILGVRIASRLLEIGTHVQLFMHEDDDIRAFLNSEGRNKW